MAAVPQDLYTTLGFSNDGYGVLDPAVVSP